MIYFAASIICFKNASTCNVSWEAVGALGGWVAAAATIAAVFVPRYIEGIQQELVVSRDMEEFNRTLLNLEIAVGNADHFRHVILEQSGSGPIPARFAESQRLGIVVPSVPATYKYDSLYRAVKDVADRVNAWNRLLESMSSANVAFAGAPDHARALDFGLTSVSRELFKAIEAARATIKIRFPKLDLR